MRLARVATVVGITVAVAAGAGAGDRPYGDPPSGGEFTLRRSTVDAGGDRSTGPDFSLEATIGQPDAAITQGGPFVLRGGYWTPAGPADRIFRDGFESP